MKKSLISLFLIICSINVFADGVWIDGICYNLNNSTNEAEVANIQLRVTPEKVKSIDFNTYNVGDMPCTNKKTSASQLAKIVTYNEQNALNVPSMGKVNIIEGFEVAPEDICIVTFWAMADKDASFLVNFSGNDIYCDETAGGRWELTAGELTKISVESKPAEDVTEGYLEITTVRGSAMNIQKVELSSYHGRNVQIPERIVSQGVEYTVTSIGGNAFMGSRELSSLTIPNSVVSIGAGAFSGCPYLTSVTIGNSVTSIGDQAFYDCSGLTSVTIPNSVTSIGGEAFYYCTGLTSVTIPNSVTSIGDEAFHGCSSLPVIDNLRYADTYLVGAEDKNCTSANIKEGTRFIGDYAFNNCSNLTSITIPNSVTSIGHVAFRNCSSLTSVTLGNSVTSIGNYAFYNCSSLSSITIPNSVTSIGFYTFMGCSSLTSVTIGNSVTSIGGNAFYGCDNVKELIYSEGCITALSTGLRYITSVSIPNSVTSIGDTAFYGCSDLTSITIPNSVTSIGNDAFEGCSGLTSITIPNSVTSIGNYAFARCYGLTSITIPNSVTSIGDGAFSGCWRIKSISVEEQNPSYDSRDNCNAIIETNTNTLIQGCNNTSIPNSVTSIGEGAFNSCHGIISITIPNSVKSIGNYSFACCSSLASIEIPNSVTSIGEGVFDRCQNVISITIPNSVKSIGYIAFRECSSLVSIEIPNSVTSIGGFAFSGCRNLTSISLPRSLTDIGEYAFNASDNSLISVKVGWKEPIGADSFNIGFNTQVIGDQTSLYVPRGTKEAYAAVFGWNRFKEIIEYDYTEVVDGIPYILDYSTNTVDISSGGESQNTGDVVIPETIDIDGESYTVTSIGENAFYGSSDLTSVSIPKSVTSIGDFAFANCTSLSEVYVEWEEPLAIPAHVFANVESSNVRRYKSKSLLSTTLYVPKGTKEKYAAADVWKDFSAIMEYDPTGISSVLTDSKAKVAKHLINGRIIIKKDAKQYNASGAEIK